MRSIPIDGARIQLIGTGKAAAKAEYVELADGQRRRSGEQARNVDRVPEWVVDVLVDDPDADRAEVVGVKVASHDEPVTAKWQPVRFTGLVAVPYVGQNGRVALSLRADGIEAVAAGSPKSASVSPAA